MDKYVVVLAKPTDEVLIPAILRKQHKFDFSDTASPVNFARDQPPHSTCNYNHGGSVLCVPDMYSTFGV